MIDFGKTLTGLKLDLQRATDFSQPWERFHDEVAMVPAYSMAGTVEANPRIELALAMGAARVLGRRWPVKHTHLVHLAEHHFWHGHCQIGPRTVICFFFDDIDIGLAGYLRSITDQQADLVRLTLLETHATAQAPCN